MKPIMYLLTAGFLLIVSQVFGQPLITSLTPSSVTVPIGGQVNLELKVTNFTNINSIQFPISYNPAVLKFDTIYDSTLPGWAPPPANYNVPTPGTIRVTWFPDPGAYPDGYTAPNGTTIFKLRFTVLTNGTIPVNLANLPPGIEAIRNFAEIQVQYQNGGATVIGGNGGPPPSLGFKIYSNSINIPQGMTGCMPVTVNDFDSISSMQYAMHWDNTVLQLQGTQSYNLPSLNAASFTTSGNPANTLILNWQTAQAGGVTRADGTKIYDVCFNAVGGIGTESLITIDGTGVSGGAKAVNASGVNKWTPTSGVTDTIFVVTTPPPPNAVTFTLDYDTAATGAQVCLALKVKNFTKVISAQFGITYDATKLQFQSIQLSPNPLGLSLASNFNSGTAGEIRFLWDDPSASGVTLTDNTIIFTVCFTVAAPDSTKIPVKFSSLSSFPPLSIEVAKEPDGPVVPAMNNGQVWVSNAVPSVAVETTAACGGGNNGTATAQVSNGTATNYNWSGPNGPISGSQQTISNLAPGNYSVTVTLAGGATVTDIGTVSQGTAITIPTQQLTIMNVKCFGENNGAINLTVSGGTPPYNYAWDGPGTYTANTEDISGLAPGIYVLALSDANGCSFTSQPYQVTEPQALSVSLLSSQNVTCLGSSTGKAEISVVGGTPTYSYAWKTVNDNTLVSNQKNPSDFQAGNYNVTVTDSRGCTDALDNPVQINAPANPLSVANPVQKTDVICNGYNTGEINLNISGGWSGNYTVNWSPQVPGGANPKNIPGGIYNATVTDQNGCSITVPPIEILQPPAISYGTPAVNHIECAGQGDGSIGIQVSGGNGSPYTVNWNGGLSGTSIGNLAGGNYTPTITDGIGCTSVLPAIPVNEPAPILTSNVVITDPTGGQPNGSVSLDITGGTGTLTIKWSGPGNYNSNSKDITNLAPGQYVLEVKDANNCTYTEVFEVGGALAAAVVSTSASCGNNGCISIDITTGIPPFIVTWNDGNGLFLTDSLSFSICTFAPGVYDDLTIADAASNVFVFPAVNVGTLPPAVISDSWQNPNGDLKNGFITLNPVPSGTNLSYDWSGPGVNNAVTNSVMNLDSGLYVCVVTNVSSGCSSVYTQQLVREWPAIVATLSQVNEPNCNNTADGSISIQVNGGNPPYNYAWSGPNGPIANSNSPTLNNVPAGVYTCIITDENGSIQIFNKTLEPESQLDVTNVNVTSNYGPGFAVSGATSCDGAANVVFSGGIGATTILWSNNVNTLQNTTLCAGAYSVVVTDALGCTASWEGVLSSPPAITPVSSVVGGITCHGECDGIARVTINGGVAPYTAKWSTGQIDQNLSTGSFSQAVNLCGGSYKVTITDKIGGTLVATVDVVEPDPITVVFAANDPTTLNSCNGELLASAPAAAEPATYTWVGSLGHNGDTNLAEGLCAGEVVQFIVVDANNCIGIGIDTVAYPTDGCYQVRPVITPGQQDGNNDFVFITCIEAVPNAIEIYNRWGQLVFETTGYDNGSNVWHGTNKNGQPLAEGVYFYVLTYTDPVTGPQQQKGHINLLR